MCFEVSRGDYIAQYLEFRKKKPEGTDHYFLPPNDLYNISIGFMNILRMK